MAEPAVSLPALPTGKEFEEFISAFFNATGHFVERNIIERDPDEILELDIIATNYDASPPDIRLIEIKSGDWGFPDLFKVRGWLEYLGLSQGGLVCAKTKPNLPLYEERGGKLGITVAVVPDLSKAKDLLASLTKNAISDERDIPSWRWSYWIERQLLRRLNQKKKTQPTVKCFPAIEKYWFDINSNIFFTENVMGRVDKLYDCFKSMPRLSAKAANEVMGANFEDDHQAIPAKLFSDTYHACIYTDVHLSTYVEHRARLAILKSAVDYIALQKAGIITSPDVAIKFGKIEIPLLDLLPKSFRDGLEELATHSHVHRYPAFWQWFLWVFGGFLLSEHQEKEFALLSLKTKIPPSEIPNALRAFDILFPVPEGWFIDLSPNCRVEVLRAFSVPFMGLGANYRRWMHTETGKWEELNVGGKYTLSDFFKWNQLAIEVLQAS